MTLLSYLVNPGGLVWPPLLPNPGGRLLPIPGGPNAGGLDGIGGRGGRGLKAGGGGNDGRYMTGWYQLHESEEGVFSQ